MLLYRKPQIYNVYANGNYTKFNDSLNSCSNMEINNNEEGIKVHCF